MQATYSSTIEKSVNQITPGFTPRFQMLNRALDSSAKGFKFHSTDANLSRSNPVIGELVACLHACGNRMNPFRADLPVFAAYR